MLFGPACTSGCPKAGDKLRQGSDLNECGSGAVEPFRDVPRRSLPLAAAFYGVFMNSFCRSCLSALFQMFADVYGSYG